jgi:hypothetical protein
MTTQYSLVTIDGSGSGQTVDLGNNLISGQQISIMPLNTNACDPDNQPQSTTITYDPLPNNYDVPGYPTISVLVGQQITITATGSWCWGEWPYYCCGPDGNTTIGIGGPPIEASATPFSLIGRIGQGGPWFFVGSQKTFVAPKSGILYLTINDQQGSLGNNISGMTITINATPSYEALTSTETSHLLQGQIGGGSAFNVGNHYDAPASASGSLTLSVNGCTDGDVTAMVVVDAPGASENNSGCTREASSQYPIQLRTGTKTLSETDLSVQTPAGTLAFTRGYNQDRLMDTNYQFMGLGWSHNHNDYLIVSGTSPNRSAQVNFGDGGILKLDEDSANAGHFKAKPGSTSVLDYLSSTSEYVLTNTDKSQAIFDAITKQLKTRVWPNQETWTYTYTSGKLAEVNDGYGRKLQFSYVSNPGQYNDGKLWRVGDQTATGLGSGSPSGRFVEFAYTPEKSGGNAISSPKALLSTVQDVFGKIWTYHWYGENANETD